MNFIDSYSLSTIAAAQHKMAGGRVKPITIGSAIVVALIMLAMIVVFAWFGIAIMHEVPLSQVPAWAYDALSELWSTLTAWITW